MDKEVDHRYKRDKKVRERMSRGIKSQSIDEKWELDPSCKTDIPIIAPQSLKSPAVRATVDFVGFPQEKYLFSTTERSSTMSRKKGTSIIGCIKCATPKP